MLDRNNHTSSFSSSYNQQLQYQHQHQRPYQPSIAMNDRVNKLHRFNSSALVSCEELAETPLPRQPLVSARDSNGSELEDSNDKLGSLRDVYGMHTNACTSLKSIFDSDRNIPKESLSESMLELSGTDFMVSRHSNCTDSPTYKNDSMKELFSAMGSLLCSRATFTLDEETSVEHEMCRLKKIRHDMRTSSGSGRSNNFTREVLQSVVVPQPRMNRREVDLDEANSTPMVSSDNFDDYATKIKYVGQKQKLLDILKESVTPSTRRTSRTLSRESMPSRSSTKSALKRSSSHSSACSAGSSSVGSALADGSSAVSKSQRSSTKKYVQRQKKKTRSLIDASDKKDKPLTTPQRLPSPRKEKTVVVIPQSIQRKQSVLLLPSMEGSDDESESSVLSCSDSAPKMPRRIIDRIYL